MALSPPPPPLFLVLAQGLVRSEAFLSVAVLVAVPLLLRSWAKMEADHHDTLECRTVVQTYLVAAGGCLCAVLAEVAGNTILAVLLQVQYGMVPVLYCHFITIDSVGYRIEISRYFEIYIGNLSDVSIYRIKLVLLTTPWYLPVASPLLIHIVNETLRRIYQLHIEIVCCDVDQIVS